MNREDELNAALELLHHAFRAVVAKPDRMLARRGLGRVHHRILYFVGRNPGCSVGRLLEILGVSKQALNAPLRQLLAHSLIVAANAPADRRAKQLRLTEAGRRLERALSGEQRRRYQAVFGAVGPEKEAAWREIMGLLADRRFD